MNKFYLVQITDVNGEYENTTSCLAISTEDEIQEKANDIARTWYAEDGDDLADDQCYHFSNGCAVYADCFREISEQTFNELKPILAVLVY